MRTVIRPLVPRMEYGLRLYIKRIPYSFFVTSFFLLNCFLQLQGQRASVSCYGRVNVSINSGTPTRLSLASLTPMNDLTNVIYEADDRAELLFNCGDVGSIVMVAVIDTIIDQRCMLEIHIEDKSDLQILCQDTSYTCIQGIDGLTGDDVIHVISSCDDLSGTTITFEDSDPILYEPDSDTLEYFVRNWFVEEENGNTLSCQSTIYLTRFNLQSLQFPQDITILCGQNAADTSITGGINYNPLDLAERCQVGVTCTIIDTIKSPCVDSFKIIKEWVAIDWTNMISRDTLQYIYVKDTSPVILQAPESFAVIQDSCDFHLVLGVPTIISSPCANVTLADVTVNIQGSFYDIGDTIPLTPGPYDVIYRGESPACYALIRPDTAQVSITDQMSPVIDCDSINDLSISLSNGMGTWIDLDSLFKSLPVMSCIPYSIEGRKVNPICTSDTGIFRPKIELCVEELRSCQEPGTIQIEIRAKADNDSTSNICLVTIDVQEKIRPVIIPQMDAEVRLDGDSMIFTLDTNVVIASLTDNSGTIASLVMTGSGIGATTGSGISFLGPGGFITFDCSFAGTYDVAIFATDCDNNTDTVVTQLSIDPEGLCVMPRQISGEISSNQRPMPDVEVAIAAATHNTILTTDHLGQFSFEPESSTEPMMITIRHDDDWEAGITVRDLQLLERYILGLQGLEPWQLASADVDDSGEISAKDLMTIHRLLRGIPTDIHEDAMPWIFSDGSEGNSFSDYYTHYVRPSVESDMTITGVKRGDIDGDVIIDASARSLVRIPLYINRLHETKTEFELAINEVVDLKSLQLSIEIKNGMLAGNPEDYKSIWGNRSHIDIVHYEQGLVDEAFIRFTVEHESGQSPSLIINDKLTPLYFDENGIRHQVDLETTSTNRVNDVSLDVVAIPNPSSEKAHIVLRGPNEYSDHLSLDVYDIQGRFIYRNTWSQVELADVFPIKLPELPHKGLFLIQIRTDHKMENLHIIKN